MRKRTSKYSDELITTLVKDSFSISEVLRKLGLTSAAGSMHGHISKRVINLNLDTSHFKRGTDISSTNSKLRIEDILVYDRRNGVREKTANLRRGLIESEVEEKCKCGQGVEWNGCKLVLQIDHIDGNPLNNILTNLRFLCPNCHSQTANYGFKGSK